VKDRVVVRERGVGGYDALASHFRDDDIAFGVCSFTLGAGGQAKYFFVTWVGPDVGALKKGRVSLQKGAVYNVCDGMVAELYVTEREQAAPASVAAKLAKAVGGAAADIKV
jgi:hypothetical protein